MGKLRFTSKFIYRVDSFRNRALISIFSWIEWRELKRRGIVEFNRVLIVWYFIL